METYDVVVVGAGPAGLNTAFNLTKAGVKVLVLEKNRIGETKKSWVTFKNLIQEEGLKECIIHEFNSLIVRNLEEKFECHTKDGNKFCALDEPKVLKTLANKVLSEGGRLSDRRQYLRHKVKNDMITIYTSKGSIKSRLLIDASGIHSELSDPNFRRWVICAKIFDNIDLDNPDVGVYSEVIPGYGYGGSLYPMGDRKAVIMIGRMDYEKLNVESIEKCFRYYTKKFKLLAEQFKNAKAIDTRIGYIPVMVREPFCMDNLIKVGDSAGQGYLLQSAGFSTSFKFSRLTARLSLEALESNKFNKYYLNSKYKSLLRMYVKNYFSNYLLTSKFVDFLYKLFVDTGLITSNASVRESLCVDYIKLLLEFCRNSNGMDYEALKGDLSDFSTILIFSKCFPIAMYYIIKQILRSRKRT
jgi:flavin-dependent dehydrogenase